MGLTKRITWERGDGNQKLTYPGRVQMVLQGETRQYQLGEETVTSETYGVSIVIEVKWNKMLPVVRTTLGKRMQKVPEPLEHASRGFVDPLFHVVFASIFKSTLRRKESSVL